MEKHFGPFAVAIVFWIFVTVAAVAGIAADYKKRKAALAPLTAAIERGQQLDPALVERLMAPEKDSGPNPLYLRVGGIITFAAGVGIMVLALFLSREAPGALLPILGAGGLVVCVGAGLIVAARAVEQHRLKDPPAS
jgi:hypothetical protein